MCKAASSLPDDLIREILVRLPPDEPAHLVRASLVCKAWRRVLSDRDFFLRRCRGIHGAAPLLGYIQNRYYKGSSMQFVPATSVAVRMPADVDYTSCVALDCRHGRVLIHCEDTSKKKRGLVVWDPVTGSQQRLRVPSAGYRSYPFRNSYTAAVLCAKDGCDDHLDCHDGSFRVVFVHTNLVRPRFACAASYSSLAGAWSAPNPCHVTCNPSDYHYRSFRKPSVLIGDVMYFLFEHCTCILKYDLRTRWLSEIKMPRLRDIDMSNKAVLMKAEDGGLGLVTVCGNCIRMWSRKDVSDDDIHGWVKHKAITIELRTLLPKPVLDRSYQVVGFAEGTNTIFVNKSTTIFTFDLKSKKMRKVGEREDGRFDFILPYMSFYTPRMQSLYGLEYDCVLHSCGKYIEERTFSKPETLLLDGSTRANFFRSC